MWKRKPMRCDEVRSQLADYAVGGLGRRRRAEISAHVETCQACRADLAALARTGELLSDLELQSAPAHAWDSIRYRIQEKLRPTQRRAWERGWSVAGLALAVLVVAAVTFLPGLKPEPETVVAVQVDAEMQASLEGHLAAVWSAPLADAAEVGLRLDSLEDDS